MCVGGRIRQRSRVPSAASPASAEPIQAENDPIALLTGVVTLVNITDFIAQVTIKQRFESTESVPIEAIYELLVNPKHSVCEFKVEIDGKVLEGKMMEKEAARAQYDDVLARGHGAYLLEESESFLFTASIGNLPPGKAVLLTIVYVVELEIEEGKLAFVLPNQPFTPHDSSNPSRKKFMRPISKDYLQEVPYGLSVHVDFSLATKIYSISSPTHSIKAEISNFGARGTADLLVEEGSPLLRDLRLIVAPIHPHQTCLAIESYASNKYAALLAIYPELHEEADQRAELLFVVDRSGSMQGSRINSVRATLQIFLRSIPEGTLFNIIGFGTNCASLFPSSREYDEKSLDAATKHVEEMKADMGGTNILNPLTEIFGSNPKRGTARQVFLLTDGEVTNTHECIREVRIGATSTRFFTFGIGGDASRALVAGIAEAGNGCAEFIQAGDDMEEKVLRQLQRALRPALTDLSVTWGEHSCTVQSAPYRLPPLFGGQCLMLYALFNDTPTDSIVRVKAFTPRGVWETSASLSASNATAGRSIFRLAARRLLADLQSQQSFMHDDSLDVLKEKFTEEDVKREIVSLSVKSGVASPLTAFLVCETRSDATLGSIKLVEISKGKQSTGCSSSSVPSFIAPDGTVCRVTAKTSAKTGKHGSAKVHLVGVDPVTGKRFECILSASEAANVCTTAPAPTAIDPSTRAVAALIKYAHANGSFPFSALADEIPAVRQEAIRAALPTGVVGSRAELILTTAIVCAIFERKYHTKKTHWALVVQKAERWIRRESVEIAAASVEWKIIALQFVK